MTKAEYMEQLSKKLRKLPKDSYQEAIEYYEEYFAEAENDEEAIVNLGTPQEAANQIIMNLAIQNVKCEDGKERNVKKGFSAIWIGILAIFAAPIALPFALTIAILVFTILIVAIVLIVSLIITAVAVGASALIGMIGSIVVLFLNPINGIATFGVALAVLGLGIILVCLSMIFCKWVYKRMTILFVKIAERGKRHEK